MATEKAPANPVSRDDLRLPMIVESKMLVGGYVTRFEWSRSPGVRATGIALVPGHTIGDWNKALFLILGFENGQICIDRFYLREKDATTQQMIYKVLDTMEWLVFKTGEHARVQAKDIRLAEIMVRMATPIFDEHGILQEVQRAPGSASFLYTPNSFGTWTDVILGTFAERAGEALGWKHVGNNRALLPTAERFMEFRKAPQGSIFDLENFLEEHFSTDLPYRLPYDG